MKTQIIIPLVCAALSQVSCKEAKPMVQRVSDPSQVEALKKAERRIQQLEEDLSASQDLQARLSDKLSELQAQQAAPLVESDAPVSTSGTVIPVAQAPRPSYVPGRTADSTEELTDPFKGVPSQILTKIQQKAKMDWPTNARMQQAQAESQVEAYQKMEGYRLQAYGTVPARTKNEIVTSAQRDWPLNYQMQASQFEDQITSYETLETWRRTGAPGLKLAETKIAIEAAKREWPTNYRMQISSVSNAMGAKAK